MSAIILVHEPASLLLLLKLRSSQQLALPGTDSGKKKQQQKNTCSHARLSAARKLARAKEGMPLRRGLGF